MALVVLLTLTACELIQMKQDNPTVDTKRIPVARVNRAFLYKDELGGIVLPGTTKEDSIVRVESYVNSWIRKQLLLQEAARKININEAEVERKILDYRYSLIAYEYQAFYIKQNLDTAIAANEIEKYYKENLDNFILKQNIVRATFIKVPKSAPRTNKIKEMVFSKKDKDLEELKTYCLSFSTAYHLVDSTWMVFDELVKNSPLAEIPNKIQFLKANPYYETSDDTYLYFLRVMEYRISDNISPLEFVRDDIRTIILNKRKVALAKQLEDDIYKKAGSDKEYEIFK
ncbi:MAG: peptidyl-prolyl cis-trans isomerase [Cyclobacteriaceae bacterium]|nr:peptidyl-prolyl cis-trans isomerase [Cyclobacteriaceae bacterium]UYN88628.1 MAG: peptidyl-prolyl cis-trans isomerase [Cyclobacteriaceae bacterium]